MRYFLMLWVACCTIHCRPARDPAGEALAFKNQLVAAIQKADEIRIVEYPNRADEPEADPKRESRFSTLDMKQRKILEQAVIDTPPAEQTGSKACFIPHHSVLFYQKGVQTDELEVCLRCSAVRLRSIPFSAPKAMPATLSAFMETLGYREPAPRERHSRAGETPSRSSPADIPAQPEPPEAAEDE